MLQRMQGEKRIAKLDHKKGIWRFYVNNQEYTDEKLRPAFILTRSKQEVEEAKRWLEETGNWEIIT